MVNRFCAAGAASRRQRAGGRIGAGWSAAVLALLSTGALLAPATASAADLTDVLDAFDEVWLEGKLVPDYFDFSIEPTFVQKLERAKITREANCSGGERCSGEDTIIINKELRYERIINQMNLDFRIGLYKDLEFAVRLPIVFGDTRSVKFARNGGAACEFNENPLNPKCVNQTNSSVDPSDARIAADVQDGGEFTTYRFFSLPGEEDWLEGPTRAGLGDVSFRLRWAPFNEERYVDPVNEVWGREHGRSSLVLGFEYTAPTADIATNERGNESVGRGLHGLRFDVAGSRRYQYVDPYFSLTAGFWVPAADTLFKDYGSGQDRVSPGPWGEFNLGIEFIPWENITEQFQQNFKIDLRGTFGYVGEGRDYSPLFDAFGSSACQGLSASQVGPTGTNPECGWIAQRWANAGFENISRMDPNNPSVFDTNHPLHADGTMDYEGYGYFGASLGLSVMPIQYVVVRTHLGLLAKQEHFMSFAKAGKDLRGRAPIDPNNPDAGTRPADNTPKDSTVSFDDIKERNPVYNPVYDKVGSRFRLEEITEFTWDIGLAFMF